MNQLQKTLNVSHLLKNTAERFHGRESIVCGSERITWGELDRKVTKLAHELIRLGIRSGDHVGIALRNSSEFVIAFYAIARAGAVMVPINPFFSKGESGYIVAQSEVKLVFCGERGCFPALRKEIPTLRLLVSVGFEDQEFISYTALMEGGIPEEPLDGEPSDDLFAILFTSGTTGRPKGAMLTHENVLYPTIAAAKGMECTEEDVFLIPNPLFHIFGVTFILRAACCGGKLVLMEKYSVTRALELIQEERVTVHPGVPTMFTLELNHPDFRSFDLSSLRTGEMAAAPCPVEVVQRIRKDMNCNVLIAYGSTETAATLTTTSFDDSDELRAETVGRPIPSVHLKVVDDNRQKCQTGEVGELVCKGPGVTKGYFKMPEETAKSIDHDGWFHTGDLATIDENGYVRIVGRKKELIIRGGFNVYPRELEETLYEHPAVVQAAIIGLPDKIYGEITCACVVLKEGEKVSEESLLDYMRERFVKYKVPDQILILEDLPATPSGKISKVKLKEDVEKRRGLLT